jgi:plasmid stabilization system protein ParE
MSRKIIKKPQASLDVIELGDYLAQESLSAAIRFAEAFDHTLEGLVHLFSNP